jgi:DNA gyrase subunit B
MSTEKNKPTYDERDISSLRGLTAVRKKPTLYVGRTDGDGIWTICREPADNFVDEALAGRCTLGYIIFGKDGSYTVADNSDGIPVKSILIEDDVSGEKHKVSALRGVVSVVHTGGKFGSAAYKASRGSHGIGIKATNALSEHFQVWTCRNGKWYTTSYARGKMLQDVTKSKAPIINGKPWIKGTVVKWTPDKNIFSTMHLPVDRLLDWCRITSYLTSGLKIVIQNSAGKKKVFYQKDGPRAFVKETLEKLKCEALGTHFYHTSPLVDCAVVFSDYNGIALKGYTNGLYNSEGGVHIDAAYRSIIVGLKPFMRAKQKFGLSELKEGIVGVLNVKLAAPKYDSQTKEKLSDDRADEPLKSVLNVAFKKFFAENKALAGRLCERCTKLRELNTQFTASKAVLKKLNTIKRDGFPSKFSPALKAKAEDRETYLVEGESAGGSAKQARNKDFQEVLPMKGKLINSLRKPERALESEEALYVLAVLGFNPKNKDHDPIANLRTGKVVLLADPDPDGYHINSLVLTLLYKFAPRLFSMGKVFVCDSPEYVAHHPKTGKLIRARTLQAMREKVPEHTKIKHIKGWGEMEPVDLEELAFSPKTRRLIKVMPISGKDKVDFVKLMGENSDYRKALLGV